MRIIWIKNNLEYLVVNNIKENLILKHNKSIRNEKIYFWNYDNEITILQMILHILIRRVLS